MTEIRTPWLTRVARVLSVLGGPLVMVPLRLVVIGALAWRRRWLQLGAFLGAVVTSELCIGPLKALIDRPRPPGAMIATDSSSFPSGHAIAASVTAIGLVVVLVPAAQPPHPRGRSWRPRSPLLMAMSRTYLGAHWLSDVIAGACIGTGLAVVWPAALELERARRRRRPAGRSRSRLQRRAVAAVTSVVLLVDRARLRRRAARAAPRPRPGRPPHQRVRHRAVRLRDDGGLRQHRPRLLALGSAIAQGGGRWSRPSPRQSPLPASA